MSQSVLWSTAFLLLAVVLPLSVNAQSAAELQKQIDDNNAQVEQLDKEIAQYQTQLDAVSSKKQTLQSTLDRLNLSIKKVTASVGVTKSQIRTTELQIQQLSEGMATKQSSIDIDVAGLAEAVRSLDQAEGQPFIIQLLNADTISTAWQDIETLTSFQAAIRSRISSLTSQKRSLADTKSAQEEKRAQLLKQQQTLTTQQGSLNATKKAQSDLLAQTKNQESTYQAILAAKQAAKASFEQALNDLQAKLQYTVDPSQVTPAGQGILRWPLDTVRLTQYFGNTAFAQSGAYNGKGHNGIDFAAPIGTPVRTSLTGTVVGVGNTDAVRGCYSFGKWVMIQHANGLSTMYAHLSQVGVTQGESIPTGEIIGYSGETGYATGPHLHFGVYVTSATQIIPLSQATKQKTPCATAVMPIAPLSGYLNPMNYLPTL